MCDSSFSVKKAEYTFPFVIPTESAVILTESAVIPTESTVIPSLSRDLLNTFFQNIKHERLKTTYKVSTLRSFDFAQDDISTSLRMTYLKVLFAFLTS